MALDARELTRDVVRTRLAEAAFTHFLEHGFDETTAEEAALAGGVSRATFFRYFSSKEDAVIVAMQSTQLDYADALRLSITGNAAAVWPSLRQAFEPAVAASEADPERSLAKARLITSIPSLRAHLAERRAVQEHSLATALGEYLGDDLRAKVLAATAIAGFDLAWRESATSGAPLRECLDRVFDLLASRRDT